jgi:ABC-type multidrug transport system fused ATPase/permease subunit
MLDPKERRRALAVGMVMLVVSVSEVAGVASVLPFLSAVADPLKFAKNKWVVATGIADYTSHPWFLYFLGSAFLSILLGSLVLRGLGGWALQRFASNRNTSWSCRLLHGHLEQSYVWYLQQNSTSLAASITAEVDTAVIEGLMPSLQLISQALISVLIVVTLVSANPALAVAIGTTMGGGFWLITFLLQRRIGSLGQERIDTYNERLRLAHDAFVAFKEIKLARLEREMVLRFLEPSERRARLQIRAGVFSLVPALGMQALIFGGLLGMTLFLLWTEGSLSSALPVIGLYAFAAYRLMPALQRLLEELAKLRTAVPALERVALGLSAGTVNKSTQEQHTIQVHAPARQDIVIRDATVVYPGSQEPAIRNVSLTIPEGSVVGIVGATGSGKSTLMDVILGLLPPNEGTLMIGGVALEDADQVRRWQRQIGYVPQQIFLTDDTLKANIAFGTRPSEIDMNRLLAASRLACLDLFIESLPDRYDSKVGDRGTRLSGGQRQRVGIARALYGDPRVLVMDEATSALDNATEHAVMNSIRQTSGNRTVVLIAHRLSTVRSCDTIFVMDKGRLVDHGTFDALERNCEAFRHLVQSGKN